MGTLTIEKVPQKDLAVSRLFGIVAYIVRQMLVGNSLPIWIATDLLNDLC